MGYPIGDQLNKAIAASTIKDFWMYSDGTMMSTTQEGKPQADYRTAVDGELEFYIDLIQYDRKTTGWFDYEEKISINQAKRYL